MVNEQALMMQRFTLRRAADNGWAEWRAVVRGGAKCGQPTSHRRITSFEASMKRVIVCLAAFVSTANALAPSSSDMPEQVVRAFYRTPVGLGTIGLPDAPALATIERFLTAGMAERLRRARAAERACIAATPKGFKPPMWETSIFVGAWPAAQSLSKTNAVALDANVALIDATLISTSKDEPPSTVRLAMTKVSGHWLIDDFSVANDGLSRALVTYAKDGACKLGPS